MRWRWRAWGTSISFPPTSSCATPRCCCWAALAGAAVTAATGIIGFIGLVAPHWVRLVAGPDHRVVLPGSALLGAALVLAADGVARTIVPPADLLVCDQLGVGVPGRPLLATVHTQFVPGRVTAILGPNGAGKSTLLAMLSGQRAPRSGHVWMGGQPVSGKGAQALARQRAVLPQDTAVAFDFTVQEVVEMGRFPHRQQPSRHEARIVTEAMQATGVAHLAGRSINTLSGGERARRHPAPAP